MRGDNELVAVHVGRLGGDGRHLPALPGLLLDLGDLLALLARRRDLSAQDDVADLALGQRLRAVREGGQVADGRQATNPGCARCDAGQRVRGERQDSDSKARMPAK